MRDGYSHRRRPGPRPVRREAAVERVRDHVRARRGHARRDHAMEVTVALRRFPSSSRARRRPRGARRASSPSALGFDEADAHRAGLVATELATNLVKHARGGGELLVARRRRGADAEIEMLALDRGPGMADRRRCARRRLLDGRDRRDRARRGPPAVGRVRHLLGSAARARRCWRSLRAKRGRPNGAVPCSTLRACRSPWPASRCAAMPGRVDIDRDGALGR